MLTQKEVRVKRQVQPEYPKAARTLGLKEERYDAYVQIDRRGHPSSMTVDGCSSIFHPATVDALMRWRFHPARKDGEPVPGAFSISLRFRP